MEKKDFYRYLFSQLKVSNIRVINCEKDYDPEFEDYFIIEKEKCYTLYKFRYGINKFNFIDVLSDEERNVTKYNSIKQCMMYSEPSIKSFTNTVISVDVAKNNQAINFFVNYIKDQIDDEIRYSKK